MKYYIVMFKTPSGHPEYLSGDGTGDRSYLASDAEWFHSTLAACHLGKKERKGEEEVIVLELALTPVKN